MYARGILFGKMKYELGDHSYVRCPETGLVADIEFKTKGYFSGTYNAIGGTIRNEKTGEVYYELSGLWNKEMQIKSVAVCCLEREREREREPKYADTIADAQKRHPFRRSARQTLCSVEQAH